MRQAKALLNRNFLEAKAGFVTEKYQFERCLDTKPKSFFVLLRWLGLNKNTEHKQNWRWHLVHPKAAKTMQPVPHDW